jgi:molybdopterin/thiamine biosynthesis adenylyltransferase
MIDHTRHVGIFYANNFSVTLIGAGGIGAISAITLGKMGVGELHVYDVDQIEDVNVATQFYNVSDIGKPKTHALREAVLGASGLRIHAHNTRVTENFVFPYSNIYISGVDSIKSRKDIWESVQNSWVFLNSWYIDARMSSEFFSAYVVTPTQNAWYADTLAGQRDEDIPDEPCTSKATIYTGCIAAGVIGSIVRKIITGHQTPGILTYDIINNQMMWLEMT